MRRALPLALGLLCACAAKKKPAAPIDNTTEKPAKRAPANPLGLVDGATWTWEGTRTVDDGGHDVTEPISLTTKITGDGERFQVTGWPDYAIDAGRTTEIVIHDGIVALDGEPWIRITPRLETVTCPETEVEYCWSVEDQQIYYRTGPDVMVYHVDEKRGLTDFTYHHNGTTDDLELHRKD